MGSKNKTSSTYKSSDVSRPLDIVEPGFGAIASHITNSLPSLANLNYTGDFVATPGAIQAGVPEAYLQAAQTARGLVPQAQQMLALGQQAPSFADSPTLAAGTGSFAGTNPGGMNAAVTAAIQPYMRNLMEQVLPSLQSAGIESGAYGGSRAQQTLPNMAIQDTGREAMNLAAMMNMQDFENTANRNLQGYGLSTSRGLGEADVLTSRLAQYPELLDTVMRMSGGAAELQGQAGAMDTLNRQSTIDNDLARFQYQMNRPFMGYDTATDILTRLTAGFGNRTGSGTQTQTQTTGGLAPIVAGAMGLASLAGGFPMAGGGSLGGSLVSSLFGRKG